MKGIPCCSARASRADVKRRHGPSEIRGDWLTAGDVDDGPVAVRHTAELALHPHRRRQLALVEPRTLEIEIRH